MRTSARQDFAQAYVVAHEVGHHVQNVLGVNAQVSRLQQQASRADANALSVRLELQADCYAGVWGHYAARQDMLDPGDVDEGLRAAAAIGDDRLQRQSQGRVVPESFTHGSSEQRARSGCARGSATAASRTAIRFGGRREREKVPSHYPYQIFARWSGARYILSPSLTWNVA